MECRFQFAMICEWPNLGFRNLSSIEFRYIDLSDSEFWVTLYRVFIYIQCSVFRALCSPCWCSIYGLSSDFNSDNALRYWYCFNLYVALAFCSGINVIHPYVRPSIRPSIFSACIFEFWESAFAPQLCDIQFIKWNISKVCDKKKKKNFTIAIFVKVDQLSQSHTLYLSRMESLLQKLETVELNFLLLLLFGAVTV